MNDFQKIEKELLKLDEIERSEVQKAQTLENIKRKVRYRKSQSFKYKPFFVGFATAAFIFIGAILAFNSFQESNLNATPPPNEELGDTDETNDEPNSAQIDLPDHVKLSYSSIELLEVDEFKENQYGEYIGTGDFYELMGQPLLIDYYFETESSMLSGVLNYKGKKYQLGELALNKDYEAVRAINMMDSYEVSFGEFYFVGAIGTDDTGYQYLFYNTNTQTFSQFHNWGTPQIYDIEMDEKFEIITQFEGKALHGANVEIVRFHENGFEVASVNLSLIPEILDEEKNYMLSSRFSDNGTIGVSLNNEAGEQNSIYNFTSVNEMDNILSDMSEEDLNQYAEDLWEYSIKVNGTSLPPDGVIEVKEPDIEITFVEKQPSYVFIPNDLFYEAKISGNYYEHIKSFDPEPDLINSSDGTIVTAIHYHYQDIESGKVITLSITDELKERLGIESNEIKIILK